MTKTAARPHPGAAKAPPQEVELKLEVAADGMDELRTHPALTALQDGPSGTERLTTSYYDTQDLTLSRQGIALRVRRIGDRFVQSVKGLATDGNAPALVAARTELEWPIGGDWAELELLRQSGLGDLLSDGDFAALQRVFASEIERTVIPIRFDAETTAEVAFDVGRVTAGSAERAVAEIEIELKSGSVGPLFALAGELHKTVPVRIATQGKAQLGLALLSGLPPAPHKAAPITVDQHASVGEALPVIARSCMAHLLANEPSALSQFEPDKGIHQMRVAVRRLRSALLLFRDLLPDEGYRWAGGELKWLAGELGAARDWDVFVGDTLAQAEKRKRLKSAVDAVALHAGEAQMHAREMAAAAIRSPRYASFLLDFAAWLETGRWRGELDDKQTSALDGPLIKLAPKWLERRYRKVAKAGKRLERQSPEERHEFRKKLKKLRYAADFVESLYPRKKTRSYVATLSKLQDALGASNDATVARELLQRLNQSAGPGIDQPVADLSRWLEKRARNGIEKLPKRYAALSDAAPFWA